MTEAGTSGDWRKAKKAATRQRIRESAMKLFATAGYGATTVEQIAADAGVTHTTFFRYFPTKEDVALSDEFDPFIVELIASRPPGEAPARKLCAALLQGLTAVYASNREGMLRQNRLILQTPEVRARLWEQQQEQAGMIVAALQHSAKQQQPTLGLRVATAAVLAAATIAVLTWAEDNGKTELPDLLGDAFDSLLLMDEAG